MINRLLSRIPWRRIWPQRRRQNLYGPYLADLQSYRESHRNRIRELEAELALLRAVAQERQP